MLEEVLVVIMAQLLNLAHQVEVVLVVLGQLPLLVQLEVQILEAAVVAAAAVAQKLLIMAAMVAKVL